MGRQLEVVTASTNIDIDRAFATLVKNPTDALLTSPDPFFLARRVQLITLAAPAGSLVMIIERLSAELAPAFSSAHGSHRPRSILNRSNSAGSQENGFGEPLFGTMMALCFDVRMRRFPSGLISADS